ncbi:hypothetical protein GMSM_46380 [Geomonas sp. Red276]
MANLFTILLGVIFLAATMSGCGGSGGGSSIGTGGTQQTVAAVAGSDSAIVTGGTVMLDGSGSSCTSGQPLTYVWKFASKPSGSNATISTPNAPTASFVADVEGSYTVKLTVTDSSGNTDTDIIIVTAGSSNLPPTARAGTDRTVATGSTVILDGGGSSDPNGDSLTFGWTLMTKPTGSAAILSNPTSSISTFVADVAGDYTVQLVVNDGIINSEPTLVTVHATAQAVNHYVITAESPNDANENTSSGGATYYDGTSASIVGGASETWYIYYGTTSYLVSYTYGLLEMALGQIPTNQTVKKAVLHLYVNKVTQVNNSDPYLALLLHLHGTGFSGNATYDWTHAYAPLSSSESVYKFPSGSLAGWQACDVTPLIQADVAAGSAWALFALWPTQWMDVMDKQKAKGISVSSADAGTDYAPYLEIDTTSK